MNKIALDFSIHWLLNVHHVDAMTFVVSHPIFLKAIS
jgi:hypothetical protein